MECDTLVARLAGLMLDRNNPDVPDLHEVRRRASRHAHKNNTWKAPPPDA